MFITKVLLKKNKSICKPISSRSVGYDWLNRTGKYKFEVPKKPVS